MNPPPINVLLVDDGHEFAALSTQFIEQASERITVTTAASVADGLDVLSEGGIDCVVSDYRLPDQTGIEFLEAAREHDEQLPFILFTGKGSETVASEAISAGVTDYFQKRTGVDQYTLLANRIENAVEANNAKRDRLRHLNAIETAREGISILNADEQFVFVNEAYAELYGYTPEELIGAHWTRLYPNEEIETVRTEIVPAIARDGYWRGVTTGLRADGGTFIEDHIISRTTTEEYVCTVRDITERKQHQQKLKQLNNVSQELMLAADYASATRLGSEMAHDILGLEINGIFVPSADDETDALTPVTCTAAAQEALGEHCEQLKADSLTWQAYTERETAVISNTTSDEQTENPTAPIQSIVCLPLGEHGVLLGGKQTNDGFERNELVLGELLANNIESALTQIERTEELSTRTQELQEKNDRLEEFTSVVSHDLRNPLAIAQGHLSLAMEACDHDRLLTVKDAHERMEILIENLLTLAQVGTSKTDCSQISLSTLAADCWHSVTTADCSLQIETTQTIVADESRLSQVFENLFRNAAEHGGETITLGALDNGFYIEDNGQGIPPDERTQVFEFGYSTSGTGSGFGLHIVKQVVTAHGWDVTVTDGSTGGARFEIRGVNDTPS